MDRLSPRNGIVVVMRPDTVMEYNHADAITVYMNPLIVKDNLWVTIIFTGRYNNKLFLLGHYTEKGLY